MFDPKDFRNKFLLPVTYFGVLGLALWSGSSIISQYAARQPLAMIEPAAGDSQAAPTPDKPLVPATTASPKIPQISEQDLKTAPELPAIPQGDKLTDATEAPPLRISPDKPEIVKLDRDAVNVLVGSEETLRAVPDSSRSIILIPRKPGATYIKVTDAEGHIIMQRHVIVGSPEKANKYLRIRRACGSDTLNCKEFSVYYCPDICHEVSVVQNNQATQPMDKAPTDAPAPTSEQGNSEYIEPTTPSATTATETQ